MGVIRKTRLPVALKPSTWMITEVASATKMAPMTTSSSSVRVRKAIAAIAPPRASEPGDTGSLALGGAIAAMAFLTRTELLLVVIGAIFVAEATSVIIQVLGFKATGKRVFLMTPIHHHFELMAWSETRIIMRFWIVGAIFASTGFTIFYP